MTDFDRYASNYDSVLNNGLRVTGEDKRYFATARARWTARRLSDFGFPTNTVLDFGCGTGESAPTLALELNANKVVGVDASWSSVEFARRTFGSTSVRFAHVSELRAQGAFDVVYLNGVFHHIPFAERTDVIAEIVSAMNPGGALAFWENNPYNPGTRWVMRRLPFDRDAVMLTPAETRRLLRSAHLEVEATEYCFFFPRLLAALRPAEPWLRHVSLGGQYVAFARRPKR